MQWRSSPRLRAGVRAARADIQSALWEAALTPLAFRISSTVALQRRRHRRQTPFRAAPQGLGASPNNPLRPRRCAVLLRSRSGRYFPVSAFAGVRLTHGARGGTQYMLPLFEGF
jgi:hypothetical protein